MSEEKKKFSKEEMEILTADLGVSDKGEKLTKEELVVSA